jgi:hypothetical protein
MKIRAVLLGAASAALVCTPAYADPISAIAAAAAFITGAIGGTAAVYTAVEIGLYAIGAVGLSYVASALAPKPPSASASPSGVSAVIEGGGVVPRSFLVGRYATSGSLIYDGTWGTDGDTPNAFYTKVIALSDLPMTALQEIWEGSTKGTYDTSATAITQGYPIAAFASGGKDNLWVIFHDGTQTSHDTFLSSTFGSDPDFPWQSTMVGVGVAYVIVTARLNQQVWSGWPDYKFAGQGAKFYDQRLDDTSGGSGSHRFDDQTTWEYTENPIVIEHNILRGVSYADQPLYGLQGLPALRLPSDSWFAGMNECDASVDDLDGNPNAQYRCGAEIPVNVQPANTIDALNMACNARIAEIGGIYKILVGAAGSSVLSFTDDDIIVSQPQSADPFPAIDSAVNGVQATYVAPDANWSQKDLPLRQNDTAVDEDGENFASVNYAMVTDPGQGQRLQLAALNEAQNHRRNSHTLPPVAIVLEPLDVVSWTSTRNGYSSKAMLCNSVTVNANLDIPVALSELDPSDYDWDPDTDPLTMVNPISVAPILPSASSAPDGFAAHQKGWTVTLTWTLMASYGFTGYDLLIASGSGASIGSATYLAQDVHANVATFSNITPGTYTFFLVARDALDIPGDAARGTPVSINFTVVAYDPGADLDPTTLPGYILAAGLNVPQVAASRASFVGTPGEGDLLVLSANDSPFVKGQLLRYTSGAWTADVPTANLTGQITVPQLDMMGATLADNIYVRGTCSDNSAPALVTLGGTTLCNSTSRGFQLTVIRRADHTEVAYRSDGTSGGTLSGHQAYDVFASSTARNNLAAALNEIRTNGNSTLSSTDWGTQVFVVITSYDSWVMNSTLNAEMQDCGATAAPFFVTGAINPYLLIGIPNLGEGRGIEIITGPGANTPYAEYTGLITAGNIAGLGVLKENAISANHIQADAVVAGKIAANAVTAGTVAADAVTAGTIAVGAVNAGTIIVDDIIVTGHLVADAVTGFSSDGQSTQVSAPAANAFSSAICGVTETYTGSPVLVIVSIDFQNADTSPHSCGVRVARDTSFLLNRSLEYDVPEAHHFPYSIVIYDPSPGSGSHTYEVGFNGDGTNIKVNERSITTLEVKR